MNDKTTNVSPTKGNTRPFGRKLRDIRKAKGLTMRAAAKKLNDVLGTSWPHSFISKIEAGDRRIDVFEFAAICMAYEVSPTQTFAAVLPVLPALEAA